MPERKRARTPQALAVRLTRLSLWAPVGFPDAARKGLGESGLARLLLYACLAALALPTFLVALPPLLDYPNHVVRLWLIEGGSRLWPLSQVYELSWSSALTNVGVDYLAAALGPLVDALPLGSALLFLALALPPLGAAALNRTIFGGADPWQIGFVFFAFSATLIAGFVNFHIALGLALLGAALERPLAPAPRVQPLVRLAIAIVLVFFHLFGLAYYVALLAAVAFGAERPSLRTLGPRVRRALQIATLPAIPALVLIAAAPSLPGAHVGAGDVPVWNSSIWSKIYVLLSAVATYALELDAALAFWVLAPLAAALVARRLKAHAGLVIAASGVLLLALVAPTAVAGTWWIDYRLPIMAVLALLAGTRPELARTPRARAFAAFAFTGLVLARTAFITHVWQQRQSDVEAVRRAVDAVPAGAAILPLDCPREEALPRALPLGRTFHNGHPTYWSLPVLAIMWRRAFVPNLFWAAGKQPLRVLPPWDEISFPEDGLWRWEALLAPASTPAHFKHWRARFQYVLLLNADIGNAEAAAALGGMSLLRDEGFARLYAIAPAH